MRLVVCAFVFCTVVGLSKGGNYVMSNQPVSASISDLSISSYNFLSSLATTYATVTSGVGYRWFATVFV